MIDSSNRKENDIGKIKAFERTEKVYSVEGFWV